MNRPGPTQEHSFRFPVFMLADRELNDPNGGLPALVVGELASGKTCIYLFETLDAAVKHAPANLARDRCMIAETSDPHGFLVLLAHAIEHGIDLVSLTAADGAFGTLPVAQFRQAILQQFGASG
jgi:hypothetical protein